MGAEILTGYCGKNLTIPTLHTVRSNNQLAIDRLVRALGYLEKLKSTGYPIESEWEHRTLTELSSLYAKVGDITKSEATLRLAQAKAKS